MKALVPPPLRAVTVGRRASFLSFTEMESWLTAQFFSAPSILRNPHNTLTMQMCVSLWQYVSIKADSEESPHGGLLSTPPHAWLTPYHKQHSHPSQRQIVMNAKDKEGGKQKYRDQKHRLSWSWQRRKHLSRSMETTSVWRDRNRKRWREPVATVKTTHHYDSSNMSGHNRQKWSLAEQTTATIVSLNIIMLFKVMFRDGNHWKY